MGEHTAVFSKNWSMFCADLFGTSQLNINWKLLQYFPQSQLLWAHTNCFYTARKIMAAERRGPTPYQQFVPSRKVYTSTAKCRARGLGHVRRQTRKEDMEIQEVQDQLAL